MLNSRQLARIAAIAVLAAACNAWQAEARTRKGDRFLAQSRAAEIRKEWDQALTLAEQALSEDPADVAYQLTTTRLRFYGAQYHVDQAKKMRDQGQLAEALAEFEKAYGINPASSIAEEEITRTRRMIESEKTKPAPPAERGMTPEQLQNKKEGEKFAAMQPVPELRALNPAPINLKMNNQLPKVLFETVGKLAGINVLFDPEYSTGGTGPAKPQSIELNNATLEESLDYLALITKSFWKPISTNAIFVTQDNPTKRREFEEWVVKVFYLKNVTSVQEIQEIVTALRSVADIQKIFTYNAQNAIIVRAEADKIALAEKMVADLDKPKPEVVVDILVMQVTRNKERDLTAAIAPNGLNQSILFTPRAGITTQTTTTPPAAGAAATGPLTVPLSKLNRIDARDFSITVPGGLLQAILSDRDTKVLQSPQVRAVDGQKVTLNIGDKVPYATGSFQPGIGGVGINPLVNTQFTFLETGVNVEIQPKVHGTDEVSLHVEVNISNVRDHVNLGGIDEPIVGQTKVVNDVRMRQGEVNLMGGLMQLQESKVVTGIPGLSSIPLLGRLFSGETITRSNSELVVALIPHIVRAPDITAADLKEIATGNSTTVKLNYAPRTPQPQAAPPAPSPESAVPPAPPPTAPQPTVPQPIGPQLVPVTPQLPGVNAPQASAGAPPATAPPVPPATAPPATAPPTPAGAKPEGAPTTPAGNARVMFAPGQVTTQPGATISVTLVAANVNDLAAAPMQIKFDPKILRLNDVVRGSLLTSDGQQVAFSKNILNDTGEGTVNISRFPSTGGVSGSGAIVTLVFQAVAQGETVVTIPQLTLRNSQSQPITATSPQLTVTVK